MADRQTEWLANTDTAREQGKMSQQDGGEWRSVQTKHCVQGLGGDDFGTCSFLKIRKGKKGTSHNRVMGFRQHLKSNVVLTHEWLINQLFYGHDKKIDISFVKEMETQSLDYSQQAHKAKGRIFHPLSVCPLFTTYSRHFSLLPQCTTNATSSLIGC